MKIKMKFEIFDLLLKGDGVGPKLLALIKKIDADVVVIKLVEEVLEHKDRELWVTLDKALIVSSMLGLTESVRLLLEDGRASPSYQQSESIIRASLNDKTDVVELLLEHGRANPTDQNNKAFKIAIENENVEIAVLILEDSRVDQSKAFKFMAESKTMFTKVVKFMLKDGRKISQVHANQLLDKAEVYGNVEAMTLLLNDKRVTQFAKIDEIFGGAIWLEQVEIVKLLLKDGRVTPKQINESLVKSSGYGSVVLVKLLLDDKRVDPFAQNNKAIKGATANGHKKTVRFFLNHIKVNPCKLHPITMASRLGLTEVVKLLLNDKENPSVKIPSKQLNYILIEASENGLIKIVDFFMKDTKYNFSQINKNSPWKVGEALIKAVENGHTEIVKTLLGTVIWVSSEIFEKVIIKAAGNGEKEIVKLLLKDIRGSTSIEAIMQSAVRSNTEILKVLLNYYSFDVYENCDEIFKIAVEKEHVEVVIFLLMDGRIECSKGFMFIAATKNMLTKVVKFMLKDGREISQVHANEAIIQAADAGNIEVMKLLLRDKRVNLFAKINEAFKIAARHQHVEIVKLLLNDGGVTPNQINESLVESLEFGNVVIVKLLLNDGGVTPKQINETLVEASSRNYVEIVKLLLKHPKVDPTAENNEAIFQASFLGHEEIVRLLLKDGRANPKAREYKSIIAASKNGHIGTVLRLLSCKRVNPSQTFSIIIASELGITETVKFLLTQECVDPTVGDNAAIIGAIMNGHLDTIKLLLDDERVILCERIYKALIEGKINMDDEKKTKILIFDERMCKGVIETMRKYQDQTTPTKVDIEFINASRYGDTKRVKELLKEGKVNPRAEDNNAFIYACEYGHINVVKELFIATVLDPTTRKNEGFMRASENGHIKVVKYLMKYRIIHPTDQNNRAIIGASKNGHTFVVIELLKDKRADPSARKNEAIILAFNSKHMGVVDVLSKDPRVIKQMLLEMIETRNKIVHDPLELFGEKEEEDIKIVHDSLELFGEDDLDSLLDFGDDVRELVDIKTLHKAIDLFRRKEEEHTKIEDDHDSLPYLETVD